MKIGITKLIAENIAPENASNLAIFDGDTKICDVDISKMRPTNIGEKLYSFGMVADLHCGGDHDAEKKRSGRFRKALEYFATKDVKLCCVAGDLTTTGLWYPISETEGTSKYDPSQFIEYQRICNEFVDKFPVYSLCGNHESYNGYNISNTSRLDIYGADPTLEINTLAKYKEYTGHELVYTVEKNNDVFVLVSQSTGTRPMSDEHLQWLYETLETNRNKRCFVFIHPYVSSESSGNPYGLHAIPTFDYWGETKTQAFINLMSHYKNTMLFHGHSHVRPEVQFMVKNVNYSTALGFRDFSLPSSSNSRTVTETDGVKKLTTDGSAFCYIADVYENCIVLKGYNFHEKAFVPIAQYCIDTTIQTIDANTFTDNTGTITT